MKTCSVNVIVPYVYEMMSVQALEHLLCSESVQSHLLGQEFRTEQPAISFGENPEQPYFEVIEIRIPFCIRGYILVNHDFR